MQRLLVVAGFLWLLGADQQVSVSATFDSDIFSKIKDKSTITVEGVIDLLEAVDDKRNTSLVGISVAELLALRTPSVELCKPAEAIRFRRLMLDCTFKDNKNLLGYLDLYYNSLLKKFCEDHKEEVVANAIRSIGEADKIVALDLASRIPDGSAKITKNQVEDAEEGFITQYLALSGLFYPRRIHDSNKIREEINGVFERVMGALDIQGEKLLPSEWLRVKRIAAIHLDE